MGPSNAANATDHYAAAGALVLLKYVCVSGYAFCHAWRYGAETLHGDRGWAPEAQKHILEVTPSTVKSHPEVKLP